MFKAMAMSDETGYANYLTDQAIAKTY